MFPFRSDLCSVHNFDSILVPPAASGYLTPSNPTEAPIPRKNSNRILLTIESVIHHFRVDSAALIPFAFLPASISLKFNVCCGRRGNTHADSSNHQLSPSNLQAPLIFHLDKSSAKVASSLRGAGHLRILSSYSIG